MRGGCTRQSKEISSVLPRGLDCEPWKCTGKLLDGLCPIVGCSITQREGHGKQRKVGVAAACDYAQRQGG